MIKNLRKKAKNKKGFTMVELIVVIVIILVLTALVVPNVLKYVEKAREANCKADAATILAQLQADYAASQAADETGVTMPSKVGGIDVRSEDVTPTKKEATYVVATGEISKFQYWDGKYYLAVWNQTGDKAGWKISQKKPS